MADTKTELIQQLVATYAEAYQNLGHSSLMGKIVALLLSSPKPLSLDDISEKLQMSKGPVSQIARKLKDHGLIEKAWIPGERKDYYQAVDDIFGQAFRNYSRSMKRNQEIAVSFLEASERIGNGGNDAELQQLQIRMEEMRAFYDLMDQFNKNFLSTWEKEKDAIRKESA